MKILIFSTSYLPFIGGAELAIKEITDRLGQQFEFDLITARHSRNLPPREKLGSVMVYRVGFGYSWLDKLSLPLLGARLAARLQKDRKYDFIHAVQASYGGIAAFRFKKIFPQIPFILNLQEGKNLDKQLLHIRHWREKVVKGADKVVVISKYLKDFAKKCGVDSDKIYLIPNGVDFEKFSRQFSYGELEKIKDELGIKPYHKVIITSSRLVKKNNIEGLIEAVAKLMKENEDLKLKLIIIGDGDLRSGLELRASELGITKDVLFLGTVDHDDLPGYLAVSRIFIRPSLSEGLGTSFLEAMAAGIPIIGTKVGGIPDFLKDFKTGLFCTADPKSIAEKTLLLLKDSELRNSISINAQKAVKEHYVWDIVAEQYREVYTK